jgi:hypothetical protein
MFLKFLFFAFLLLTSCGQNSDQCTSHTEQEVQAIERMMNLNFAYDAGKWMPASAYKS